jgi:hypothetical protein
MFLCSVGSLSPDYTASYELVTPTAVRPVIFQFSRYWQHAKYLSLRRIRILGRFVAYNITFLHIFNSF